MTPRKEKGVKTGPRRIDGALLDVCGAATFLGDTEHAIRAQVARGLLPHRRRGGRIVFLRAELEEFLRRLPGVTLDEALRNVVSRTNGLADAAVTR